MCYCIIISLWIHLFIFCVIVQYPVLWVSFACVAVHVIGPGRGNGHRVGIASPRYPIVISFPPLLKHIDVHCRSNDVKLWMISVVFSLPSILSPTTVVSSRWATRFSQLWSFNCILQPGNCCMSGWGWFYFLSFNVQDTSTLPMNMQGHEMYHRNQATSNWSGDLSMIHKLFPAQLLTRNSVCVFYLV